MMDFDAFLELAKENTIAFSKIQLCLEKEVKEKHASGRMILSLELEFDDEFYLDDKIAILKAINSVVPIYRVHGISVELK